MKALTISQPYASLIANGAKWVENRVWRTGYRGPLAIHAGSGTQYLTKKQLARYPTGCVIAVAELVACVWLIDVRRLRAATMAQLRTAHVSVESLLGHRYTEGPWCWVLQNVRQIEPVAAKGMIGLWEWEPDAMNGAPVFRERGMVGLWDREQSNGRIENERE